MGEEFHLMDALNKNRIISRSSGMRQDKFYLYYFKAAVPHGSITRGDISLVKTSDSFPGLPYVFELYTKTGLIWYLQASSQVSRNLLPSQ